MGETNLRAFFSSDAILLAVILFVGIAGSGVARWGLGVLGLDTLGMIVFVMGYG